MAFDLCKGWHIDWLKNAWMVIWGFNWSTGLRRNVVHSHMAVSGLSDDEVIGAHQYPQKFSMDLGKFWRR